MIIFRYLTKEVLFSALAVTLVLLLIILSGRFINYMADAANGELAASVLFPLIGYRIPGFMELILPLGLFLGILLAYGRLYLDQEITVLTACGYSHNRLQFCAFGAAVLIAIVVAVLSLWVTPWANRNVELLLDSQADVNEFDVLTAGRFQKSSDGTRVTYIGALTDDRTRLQQVFLSEDSKNRGEPKSSVIMAASGNQVVDPETRDRFLVLKDGYRYVGEPGQADYLKLKFDEYGVKLQERDEVVQISDVETLPTKALFGSNEPVHQAHLHWRLSLPVLCLVVSILAVALSRVNPRQGRFARILPSILLYLVYIFMLSQVRSQVEDGEHGNGMALWLVHIVFFAIALAFHFGIFGRLNPWQLFARAKPVAAAVTISRSNKEDSA